MTPERLMKSRVNSVFLILCLTLVMQIIAALPSSFFTALGMFGIVVDEYYTGFVLPQILYPVCNFIMVLIGLRCIGIPLSFAAGVKRPKADFFPWLGVFLGIVVIMNHLVTWAMALLEMAGIPVPDVFASYIPGDIPQAVCYVFVLAILPAVCEEVLCRCLGTGLLKNFHPWTAIFVSAAAFGLMHSTLQQIPFAFVLGLVLGFVYVKTGNLLYPILLHFVNNAWACALTCLSVWTEEDVAETVSYGADVLFVLFGICSLIFLMRKGKFTLREIPHSLSAGEAVRAVVRAPLVWVFAGLYTFMTLINYVTTFFIFE